MTRTFYFSKYSTALVKTSHFDRFSAMMAVQIKPFILFEVIKSNEPLK